MNDVASKNPNRVVVGLLDITISFGLDRRVRRRLFSPLSVELPVGKTIAILGPNGSGKSTILKLILGQIEPSTGTVYVEPQINDISFIPQDYRKALFPWLSLSTHVDLYGQDTIRFDHQFFQASSTQFGLKARKSIPVSRISGGEQQLFLLNLALSRRASLYLLDEPFSAVDLGRRSSARNLVRSRLRATGAAAILVTHNLEDASILAESAIILPGSDSIQPILIEKSNEQEFLEQLRRVFHDLAY